MDIDYKYKKNFVTQFNKLKAKYGEEMAALNGFSDDQLNFTTFTNNFIDTDVVADISADPSSNVQHKDVRTLANEMPKSVRKLWSFNKVYYELNKRFDYKTANLWFEKEFTRALYMHDADTCTLKPYCYAYTLKRLAEDGLFFIDGFNYQPAEHLITFIDFVKEFVSFNSNLTSGAVGLPDLVPYMYYFWKKDVDDMYVLRDPLYHAKQNIQRFIFAVNQPAVRDSIQSAFTNVNFFDEDYLMALFGGSTFPDGSFMVDELDGIMQFQKWFIEEIISTRHQNVFTYPVASISMIYKDHKFNNEEFAKDMIRYNMEWSDFNLFCSDSVTSLSNCCRLKSNIDDLGYFSSIGGTALRVGSVKVSTVNLARIAYESSNEKEFLIKLKDMVELDLKVLDVIRHIIKRNIEKGLLPNYCDGLIDLSTQYNTIGM